MVTFDKFLQNWSLWSNSVTRQVTFKKTKIGGKSQTAKNQKYDILSDFQTICDCLRILSAFNWSFKESASLEASAEAA